MVRRGMLLAMLGFLCWSPDLMAQHESRVDGLSRLTQFAEGLPPVVSVGTASQSCDVSCGTRSSGLWIEALGTRTQTAEPLWSSSDCRTKIDGWMSQGFTINPDTPPDRFNGPVTFNDRANEYQFNQLYLTFERMTDWNGVDLDWGARVDLLVGSDYFFTTSIGLETHSDGTPKWNGDGPRSVNGARASLYGLALPQAYAALYTPIGHGLEFKVGHFYTYSGIESVQAPQNFFYSHSYAFQYGQPRTLTGLRADYRLDPNTTVSGVIHKGWDATQGTHNPWGLVGNICWTSCDEWTVVSWSFLYGDESGIDGNGSMTLSNLVVSYRIDEVTRLVFEQNYGVQTYASARVGDISDSAKWYGLAACLLTEVSEDWSAGVRLEWFRDQDNARVAQFPVDEIARGGNYFAVTLGANYTPYTNLTVRPELRVDWSDFGLNPPFGVISGAYDSGTKDAQLTLGVDVIYRF